MPPTNFPNGIASQGVPMMPGVPLTTGTYFFVHSGQGSDSASGRDKLHPLATVQAAINKCTAGRGDCILLMPGHAETVTATNIALNISGVQVVGLGTGLGRPTFTYGAAAATITVSAANCAWKNCYFLGAFDNIVAAFSLTTAKDFECSGNAIVDGSASLGILTAVITNATANAADGLKFNDNFVWGLDVAPTAVVSILGNCDRLEICRNFVNRAATNNAGQMFTVAALVCLAAKICENILNVVGATGTTVAVFGTGSSTTNTGIVARNLVSSLDTTAGIFITATLNFAVHENYMSGVVAGSGTLAPDADDPEG